MIFPDRIAPPTATEFDKMCRCSKDFSIDKRNICNMDARQTYDKSGQK